MRDTIKAVEEFDDYDKLEKAWDILPLNKYSSFINIPVKKGKEFKNEELYECCGKKFGKTIKIQYLRECLQLIISRYGERALQAERNIGIDWKAISHAFRAGYQLKEIYIVLEI